MRSALDSLTSWDRSSLDRFAHFPVMASNGGAPLKAPGRGGDVVGVMKIKIGVARVGFKGVELLQVEIPVFGSEIKRLDYGVALVDFYLSNTPWM